MYSFKSKVRYSELDSTGRLSIKSMMDYLQDCSTFQSESLGLGIEYLKKNKRAWWLASWNIDIISLPGLAEEITVSTNAHGFKGIYGYRNIDLARDCINTKLKLSNISVWYKKMALLGDVIYPYVVEADDRYIVELNNGQGATFAYVSMRKFEE